MRKSLSVPTAMQGLLRYFCPSQAGCSRVASAEKRLCARGTDLWDFIRNLVYRGKVGWQMGLGSKVGGGGWGT